METATQGLRLVLSGVFDAYPKLKIILGHLGEGLPFLLWRIDMGFERERPGGRAFRDVFSEHFYITTSGFFSDPALLCCVQETGRRPHHVLGRLAVRAEQAGDRLAADHSALRRGPGEDRQRQRDTTAEALNGAIRSSAPRSHRANAAIAAIGDDLGVFDDWMDRYQFIIEMGRKLPPFPDAWADDAHRVPGCQSRVWMEGALRDGKLFLAGISDAAIVSGLIALLLRVYSGRTPEEIVATDPVFLKDLGLLEALSTNRGNGIAAMARKIREVAALQRAA